MAQYPNPFNQYTPQQQGGGYPLDYQSQTEASFAVGRFMNAVYAWMCAGLALTAVVAWYVAANTQMLQAMGNGIWVLFIVQMVLVGVISAATERISAATATALFLLYAALNGVMFSGLLLIYAHAAVASAFIVTAAMFGVTSVYGFATKRDLTGVRNIAFMTLIGLIIASVVSVFWHPTWMTVAINYIGVIVFVALTAYDTQRMKLWALQTAADPRMASRLAVNGALRLYLDFLNLFIFLVQILGSGSRNSR